MKEILTICFKVCLLYVLYSFVAEIYNLKSIELKNWFHCKWVNETQVFTLYQSLSLVRREHRTQVTFLCTYFIVWTFYSCYFFLDFLLCNQPNPTCLWKFFSNAVYFTMIITMIFTLPWYLLFILPWWLKVAKRHLKTFPKIAFSLQITKSPTFSENIYDTINIHIFKNANT